MNETWYEHLHTEYIDPSRLMDKLYIDCAEIERTFHFNMDYKLYESCGYKLTTNYCGNPVNIQVGYDKTIKCDNKEVFDLLLSQLY